MRALGGSPGSARPAGGGATGPAAPFAGPGGGAIRGAGTHVEGARGGARGGARTGVPESARPAPRCVAPRRTSRGLLTSVGVSRARTSASAFLRRGRCAAPNAGFAQSPCATARRRGRCWDRGETPSRRDSARTPERIRERAGAGSPSAAPHGPPRPSALPSPSAPLRGRRRVAPGSARIPAPSTALARTVLRLRVGTNLERETLVRGAGAVPRILVFHARADARGREAAASLGPHLRLAPGTRQTLAPRGDHEGLPGVRPSARRGRASPTDVRAPAEDGQLGWRAPAPLQLGCRSVPSIPSPSAATSASPWAPLASASASPPSRRAMPREGALSSAAVPRVPGAGSGVSAAAERPVEAPAVPAPLPAVGAAAAPTPGPAAPAPPPPPVSRRPSRPATYAGTPMRLVAPPGRVLCLYHWPCPDGATAALCLHAYYEWGWRERGSGACSAADRVPLTRVTYVPNSTYDPATVEPLALGPTDTVYLLDFSGPPGFLAALLRSPAYRVVLLDHHKTAFQSLAEIRVVGTDAQEPEAAAAGGAGDRADDGAATRAGDRADDGAATGAGDGADGGAATGAGDGADGGVATGAAGGAADGSATGAGRGVGRASADRLETVVDMHRSGAGIALDYFFPERELRGGDADAGAGAAADRPLGASDSPADEGQSSIANDTSDAAGPSTARDCPPAADAASSPPSAGPLVSSSCAPPAPASPRTQLLPLVRFIQDADLWLWRVDRSRLFHAGFGALALDLDARRNPGVFRELATLDLERVLRLGEQEDARVRRLEELVKRRSFVVRVGGLRGVKGAEPGREHPTCLGAYLDSEDAPPTLRSRLGNALAAHSRDRGLEPVAVLAYVEEEMKATARGRYKISLRSLGDWDTTRVTELWGGGGHRNASGCTIDRDVFENEWVEGDERGPIGERA